jgi:chromodomain-helicase-DNA-binding protein 7
MGLSHVCVVRYDHLTKPTNTHTNPQQGLGKTVQTVAFIHSLVNKQRAHGPYLVVAPLSTLQHWYREFTSWTDLNMCVGLVGV